MITAELAARYKEEGMLAYVNLVQRKEKEIDCDVLTHQKWYVNIFVVHKCGLICLQEWRELH